MPISDQSLAVQEGLHLLVGGTSGIGVALVQKLVRQGREVLFTYYTRKDEAHSVCRSLQDQPCPPRSVGMDVRDGEAIAALIAKAGRGEYGLASLVYLAGTSQNAYLRAMSDQVWHEALDIHLSGAFRCMRESAALMGRQRYGRIVLVSSDAALVGSPVRSNYCAAKAGLIGLAKAAARELAPFGVTVNVVSPGMIRTPRIESWSEAIRQDLRDRIPLRRFGEPEEAASLIAYLCSREAGYITGQVYQVDGGLRM